MESLTKYNALGNAYLVGLEDSRQSQQWTPGAVQTLCSTQHGIGADGLLCVSRLAEGRFKLTIWNPDGSQAEKSGNGIRIAAAYLWSKKHLTSPRVDLVTASDTVSCRILNDGTRVSCDMGFARFARDAVPVLCDADPVLDYPITLGGTEFRINAVSMGNPHCVVFCSEPTPALAKAIGPELERHAMFPRRTNVQLVRVVDRHTLQMEIWERGAGYTLSSGTSSCAAMAVARKRGFVEGAGIVKMPGGCVSVDVRDDYNITLEGDVQEIADLRLHERFARTLGPLARIGIEGSECAGGESCS